MSFIDEIDYKAEILLFQIYYWDDDSAEPRLIEVVGCEPLCSLETFRRLTQHVLSYDYKEDCKLIPIANINKDSNIGEV